MSGMPNKNPSDADKFREQYMNNLALRAKLNDVDLQANKMYKRTGVIPAELSDFRTTSEKLADIEMLKVEVRSKLMDIADGQESNKIAQSLTDNELLFYAQTATEINAILKPKYRFGIYAEIFIPFLQRYMNDTASANGVETGLQQAGGKRVLMNAENYARALATQEQLKSFVLIVEQNIKNAGMNDYFETPPFFFRTFQEVMNRTGTFLTTPKTPLKLVEDINRDADQNSRMKNLEDLNNVFKDFPTKSIMDNQLDRVVRIIATTDRNALTNALREVVGKVSVPPETEVILKRLMEAEGKKKGGRTIGSKNKPKVVATAVLEAAPATASTTAEAVPEKKKGQPEKQMKGQGLGSRVNAKGKPKPVKARKRIDVIVPEEDIDYSKGLLETKRFAPIGRYIINTHRLNKDVIALKRPSGSTLVNFPSEKVSSRLGDVVRLIVGGSIPSYEDFEALDDTERAYLHRIAKESRIIDRLSIPAPNKNELDKEIDDFEKMRGQILAGNDNKDLVRKFKLLLLKLTHKNIIPKTQSREILFELTTLGF